MTGAQSCLRSGSAYIGRASSSSTDEPPLRMAYSFFSASVSERFDHLGHRALVPQAGVDAQRAPAAPASETVSGHSGVIV